MMPNYEYYCRQCDKSFERESLRVTTSNGVDRLPRIRDPCGLFGVSDHALVETGEVRFHRIRHVPPDFFNRARGASRRDVLLRRSDELSHRISPHLPCAWR